MASNEKGDGAESPLEMPLKTTDPELHGLILKEKVSLCKQQHFVLWAMFVTYGFTHKGAIHAVIFYYQMVVCSMTLSLLQLLHFFCFFLFLMNLLFCLYLAIVFLDIQIQCQVKICYKKGGKESEHNSQNSVL